MKNEFGYMLAEELAKRGMNIAIIDMKDDNMDRLTTQIGLFNIKII